MPPKSFIWEHFYSNRTKYRTDASHSNAWCKYCVRVHVLTLQELDKELVFRGNRHCIRSEEDLVREGTALLGVSPKVGKIHNMKMHLLKDCQHIPSDVRKQIKTRLDAESPSPAVVALASQLGHRQSPISIPSGVTTDLGASGSRKRKSGEQAEFERDLCEWFVACDFAWNAANNPQTRIFSEKWLPKNVVVPDRRTLSGRVLDEHVKDVEGRVKEKVNGRFATGQCDGWKNVAKTNVVTTVMTVENEPYLVKTHNMTGEPKTGDRLFELVLEDIQLMKDRYSVDVIAWCTDDGPDGKKMRRLLREHFNWILVLLCWAHQINLIVGDFLGLKVGYLASVKKALAVIVWFNGHSTALALLNKEQCYTYAGDCWALVLPVITRWTAHYLSISRLLKVKRAIRSCGVRHEVALLECAGRKAELKEAAGEVLNTIAENQFWDDLTIVHAILEPLAIAANITQSSHTRLDHVLITLANLYRIYSNANIDDESCKGILTSLEKRWAKADQDIFILGVFFNPFIRQDMFSLHALPERSLFEVVKRVFERVYNRKSDAYLLMAFTDYWRKRGEFCFPAAELDDIAKMFSETNLPLDLVFVWKRIDTQKDGDAPIGRNALTKLAIRILSVIANSAGCERSFSIFGNIHTKKRNKLDTDTVHKTGILKTDIMRRNITAGLVPKRKRRRFGDLDVEPELSSAELIDAMVADATATQSEEDEPEDDEDEDEDLPATIMPIRPIPAASSSTQKPRKIKLKDLFNYPVGPEENRVSVARFEFYWKAGIKNLDAELAAYDASVREEGEDDDGDVEMDCTASVEQT